MCEDISPPPGCSTGEQRLNGTAGDAVRVCRGGTRGLGPNVTVAQEKDVGVLMAAIAFEQFGHQWSAMETLSRAHSFPRRDTRAS